MEGSTFQSAEVYEDGVIINIAQQQNGFAQSAGGAGGEATNQTACNSLHDQPHEKVDP